MPVVSSPQTELPETDRAIDRPAELDDTRLPDQVRILRLLDANDGRLWQTEVVDALDISKATVSRRLAELEETDHISRMLFRGQNLIWLQDEAPEAMESALA